MSEELAQEPYVAARVGLEVATLRAQGSEIIKEPPRPTLTVFFLICFSEYLYRIYLTFIFILIYFHFNLFACFIGAVQFMAVLNLWSADHQWFATICLVVRKQGVNFMVWELFFPGRFVPRTIRPLTRFVHLS